MNNSQELSIITPLSRPENLLIIENFIPKNAEWIIVSDGLYEIPVLSRPHIFISGPETNDFGNTQRQMGLEVASRSYVYFLDDDNLMIPVLPDICIPLTQYYEADAVLFGIFACYHDPHDLWFPPDEVVVKSVDTAMLFVKLDVLKRVSINGSKGWPNIAGSERESDYYLINELSTRTKLIKLPAVLGFHNAVNNLDHEEMKLIQKDGNFPYNVFFDRFSELFLPRWMK